jgi:hypothetical protein
MKRTVLAILVPPFAVCRYGCAGCCAAPIGVFWITGIISLIYGYRGGPVGDEANMYTMGLGILLWLISIVWALVTIHTVDEDKCQRKSSPICSKIMPRPDESDPMDEVKKAH